MKTLLRRMLSIAALSVAVPLTAWPASGQIVLDPPLDHLKCYQIKDSLAPSFYSAELLNQFGLEKGCRIRVPARLLCAETNKRIQPPAFPPGGGPAGDPAGHFLCYAIRCEASEPVQPFVVQDQFGTRVIAVDRERLLCAPADKFICGDGDLDPGEQCDPGNTATMFCPDGTPCADDCSCPTDECECGTDCVTSSGAVGMCRPTAADPDDCACVPPPPPDCVCGDSCTDENGQLGTCRPLDPTSPDCQCFVPPPPPDCVCGDSCTAADGQLGTCRPLDPTSPDCQCFVPPPPPDCVCGDSCTAADGQLGTCRPLDPTSPDCQCFVPPPPPDCPCGVTCTDDAGNTGQCRPVPGSNECRCFIPPPPPVCPCGKSCEVDGEIGRCLPDRSNPGAGCVCTRR